MLLSCPVPRSPQRSNNLRSFRTERSNHLSTMHRVYKAKHVISNRDTTRIVALLPAFRTTTHPTLQKPYYIMYQCVPFDLGGCNKWYFTPPPTLTLLYPHHRLPSTWWRCAESQLVQTLCIAVQRLNINQFGCSHSQRGC